MKPAPFRYESPRSVSEAVALLGSEGHGARLLAGGQSLVPLLVRRVERPTLLIDINRIESLERIEVLPSCLQMGALVRQQEGIESSLVRTEVPGVAAALAWVANPVVRNRGSIVGNLVVNGPGAELPAVALALGAAFVLQGPEGEQVVPARGLLGPGMRIPRNVLVTHVRWPRRPARVGFYEVARRHGHAPVVSALVSMTDTECRVGVSGVCAGGLACASVAGLIATAYPRIPSLPDIASALQADLEAPLYSDACSGARYRLEVAPVVIERALRMIADGALAG